jgi:hypothetical protein
MDETLFINDLFRKFDKREQQTILQEAGLERERDIKLPAQVQLLIPLILRRMRGFKRSIPTINGRGGI